MRGFTRSGVVDQIRAAGGEIYAVTSEPQALADRAGPAWELDFETVGDPHHEIAQVCRDRGWLDLIVNSDPSLLQREAPSLGYMPTHPKGYYQPGVLVLTEDARVAYRWRSIPNRANAGGAAVRPTPEHVWQQTQAGLADATDVALDDKPTMDAPRVIWPLFVGILIANGWFIRGRPFPLIEGGPTHTQRIRRALRRLVGFVALWVLAFVFLPALPVAIGLGVWTAWIVPQIIHIHRHFQNVPG